MAAGRAPRPAAIRAPSRGAAPYDDGMSAAPRFRGLRGPDDEYDAAFDRADRLTGRVARGMAVGLPVWLVLLFLLPQAGFGPLPALLVGTILAFALTEAVERMILRPLAARRRRRAEADAGIGRAGRALVIGGAAWITVGVAMALNGVENAYVVVLGSLAAAVVVVEAAERLVVRPWQRRRAER
jgi:hypothetical protein